jgi:hypothetical protein
MLILRATDETWAAWKDVDFDEIISTMGPFNDELIKAGVLVAAEGLDDARETVVVDYSSTPPVVTDGPYGETKELFNGYWIIEVASKEEAIEWAKRAPMSDNEIIELRQVQDFADYPPDVQKAAEGFQELQAQAKGRP